MSGRLEQAGSAGAQPMIAFVQVIYQMIWCVQFTFAYCEKVHYVREGRAARMIRFVQGRVLRPAHWSCRIPFGSVSTFHVRRASTSWMALHIQAGGVL